MAMPHVDYKTYPYEAHVICMITFYVFVWPSKTRQPRWSSQPSDSAAMKCMNNIW